MIKYTFLYRLKIKGKINILRFETIEKNLRAAVGQWEKFKLTQTRIRDLIVFIRVIKKKVLN